MIAAIRMDIESQRLTTKPGFVTISTFRPSTTWSNSFPRRLSPRRKTAFVCPSLSRPSKEIPNTTALRWRPLRCCEERWLPPSVATVTDNLTGSRIYIVGCVHGSNVSANDVRTVLDKTDPEAVVLELCEPRLKSLQRTIARKSTDQPFTANIKARKRKSFAQLRDSFGGSGPAVVAIILEKVYEFQTFVGVDPGIEFVEPIVRFPSDRVICGDALAKDTVKALFKAFAAPLRSLSDCIYSIKDLLNRIVFVPKGGVRMFSIFVRDPVRLLELFRLILPAGVLSTIIGVIGNAGALALDLAPTMSGSVTPPMVSLWSSSAASVLQTLLLAYFNVSLLRFMKVLIPDRDQVIAGHIVNAASKFKTERGDPANICVVVGLFHVNGILRILQDRNKAASTT